MKYHSMIPELTISDIEITKDFYLNKLGFTLEYEREDDKFIFLSYNGSQLMPRPNGYSNLPIFQPSSCICSNIN